MATNTSQDAVIPLSVEGKNYLVTAKPRPDNNETHLETYCISVLGQIDITSDYIQAIVIVPTSVIAEELSIVLRELAKQLKINLVICTGKAEAGKLHPKGQIIVGTCTHIHNLMKNAIISASKCKFMVIDAVADLFLATDDMIEDILRQAPINLNIFLFSATFPLSITELMKLPRICNVTRNECIKCKVSKDFSEKVLREKFDFEVKFKLYQEKSDSKIQELECTLKDKESRIKDQETRIKEQETKIKEQETKIKDQESRIKELESNVEMLVKVTENLQKNLRDCLEEIKKLTPTSTKSTSNID